jgi:hypothetical protein
MIVSPSTTRSTVALPFVADGAAAFFVPLPLALEQAATKRATRATAKRCRARRPMWTSWKLG